MQDNEKLLAQFTTWYDLGRSNYRRDFRRMRCLDMTDRGELWRAIGSKYPAYQILPDTNYVSYVKSNLLASIYSVTKSAEIVPTSENDKDLCVNINVALDALWDTQDVGYYQFQAGERAALCNLGLTQVGWDENKSVGSGTNILKGQVTFKNIMPDHFMRDPFAESLDSARWCVTYDDYDKNHFLSNSKYKDAFKKWYEHSGADGAVPTQTINPDGIVKTGQKDYFTLFIWWYREDGKINEVHTVNNQAILYTKKDIRPSCFPFAQLYSNPPAGALIGTSEPAKIFANNIASNLLDSLMLTAEYKNQRPPKFISDQSKLNIQAFAKHGDDPDKTFVVSGDATKAVHYHQYPAISAIAPNVRQMLQNGIETVSGIDGRYTGRDTGSIITTGGTEEMLNRVTLIDTPKIMEYERYCKELTRLVLLNMIEFCPKRKFFRKKPNTTADYEVVEVDFPKIDAETLFNYRIAVSSELPKNKQRIAAMATELLQAQAQYREQGDNVNWITEEEWLMFQDIPMKEYMLERMGVQRRENALEEVSQVLYNFSGLVNQGMTPEQAMLATAQQLQQTRAGIQPEMVAGPNPDLQAMAGGAADA